MLYFRLYVLDWIRNLHFPVGSYHGVNTVQIKLILAASKLMVGGYLFKVDII